jgi:hypothetical protein
MNLKLDPGTARHPDGEVGAALKIANSIIADVSISIECVVHPEYDVRQRAFTRIRFPIAIFVKPCLGRRVPPTVDRATREHINQAYQAQQPDKTAAHHVTFQKKYHVDYTSNRRQGQ